MKLTCAPTGHPECVAAAAAAAATTAGTHLVQTALVLLPLVLVLQGQCTVPLLQTQTGSVSSVHPPTSCLPWRPGSCSRGGRAPKRSGCQRCSGMERAQKGQEETVMPMGRSPPAAAPPSPPYPPPPPPPFSSHPSLPGEFIDLREFVVCQPTRWPLQETAPSSAETLTRLITSPKVPMMPLRRKRSLMKCVKPVM